MLFKGFSKDNKGLSLVELLVAVAIAAIISGSIGYLLVYSLRMYKKETVSMSLQQELQTTINMVMDSAMESQCLILNNSGEGIEASTKERYGKTDSLVLGKFEKAASGKYKFTGMVFASSDNVYSGIYDTSSAPANGTLYMRRCTQEEFTGDDIKAAAAAAIDGVKGDNKYLLATNVENFYVYVDNTAPSADLKPGVLAHSEASPAENQGYTMWREVKDALTGTYKNIFNNYITLNVMVSFAAPANSVNDFRKVSDKALLRNFINEGVYVNGEEYKELSKVRMLGDASEDGELLAQTEEYVMEENLVGYATTGGEIANSFDFNILEILPDKRYASVGYTVGGQEPYTSDELDAMYNSFTGGNNDGRNASNLYYNTYDMSGICVVDAKFDGYFEYVGPGNGYYAIDEDGIASSNSPTYSYRTVDDGQGGTKDIVTNVVMISKGSYKSNIDNSRFCWKWVETNTYEEVYAVTRQQIEDAMNNRTMGFSIYVHDYRKGKIFNNEAFACGALRDLIEEYTTDGRGTIDINNGIYNFGAMNMSYMSYTAQEFRDLVARDYEDGGTIRTENYTAYQRWKNAGYGITVTSVLANEVTDAMVDRADLIIVGEKSDGAYAWSLGQYGILNEAVSNQDTNSFGPSNDLTFSQIKKIYYKAAVEKSVSLAMATAANSYSAPCMQLLFKMMFCTVNNSLSADDVSAQRKAHAYTRKKERLSKGYDLYPDSYGMSIPYASINGTGRELYTDFFKSMAEDALSEAYYSENPGVIKATDYVYIDDSGNVVIEAVTAGSEKATVTQVRNPYNPSQYLVDTYGSATVPYTTWESDIFKYLLLTQYQNLTHDLAFRYNYDESPGYVYAGGFDRESKKRTLSTKTYVFEEGGSEVSRIVNVKNGFAVGMIGGSAVYQNTLAYNNDSQLFKYQKDGSLGLLWIRSILDDRGEEDIVGIIDVKGAGERTRDVNDSSKKYSDSKVSYTYTATSGANGKIISMNEYDLEDCMVNGLDVYCLLSARVDPLSSEAALDTNMYNTSNESTTYSGTALADGRYQNGIKKYEYYPTEFVYHIPKEYFTNFKIPMNEGKNEFVATMTVTVGSSRKKVSGSETFYIVVRDLFDLD